MLEVMAKLQPLAGLPGGRSPVQALDRVTGLREIACSFLATSSVRMRPRRSGGAVPLVEEVACRPFDSGRPYPSLSVPNEPFET